MSKMHKEFDFTQQGGFPLNQDRLAWMQAGAQGLSEAIVGLVGNNAIVSGLEQQGSHLTPGWVVLGGELMPFAGGAGSVASMIRPETTTTSLTYQDTTSKAVQTSQQAVLGAGSGAVPISSLRRINRVLSHTDIVDNLTTDSATAVLSARQGKVLQEGKVDKGGSVNKLTFTHAVPLTNMSFAYAPISIAHTKTDYNAGARAGIGFHHAGTEAMYLYMKSRGRLATMGDTGIDNYILNNGDIGALVAKVPELRKNITWKLIEGTALYGTITCVITPTSGNEAIATFHCDVHAGNTSGKRKIQLQGLGIKMYPSEFVAKNMGNGEDSLIFQDDCITFGYVSYTNVIRTTSVVLCTLL